MRWSEGWEAASALARAAKIFLGVKFGKNQKFSKSDNGRCSYTGHRPILYMENWISTFYISSIVLPVADMTSPSDSAGPISYYEWHFERAPITFKGCSYMKL